VVGKRFGGGGEGWKLTRRSVHDGTTRVGKHDGDDVVRVRGQSVPSPGSTRATMGSSWRW
jgi:hypothetical protein